jgi:hypothetical protein
MNRPNVGDTIKVSREDEWQTVHVCTVGELLSTQLTAVYEYQRPDGGWNERTLFCFYSDVEWDSRMREWIGRAG